MSSPKVFVCACALSLAALTSAAWAQDDDDAAADGPTPAELAAENLRLATENAALRSQIDELTAVPVEPPPHRWAGFVRLLLSMQQGTADVVTLTGTAGAAWTDNKAWNVATTAIHTLQITNGVTSSAEGNIRTDATYSALDWFAPFGFTQIGYVDTRDIDFQFMVGLGATFTLARDPWAVSMYGDAPAPKFTVQASIGISFVFESFHPATATPDSALLRLLVGAFGEVFATDDVVIRDTITVQPAFEDFEDVLLSNQLTIEIMLEEGLNVSLSYRLLWDTRPPAGVTFLDHLIAFALGWDWKA